MPGKPGSGGPVPKRSEQRRRRNKGREADKTVMPGGVVEAPPVNGAWHPIAQAWYRSLTESGQARWYEPSDWAAAHYVAEMVTRHLWTGGGDERSTPGAQMFATIWSAMTDLLTTEGARRRVRLEIERDTGETEDGDSEVARLDEFRRRAAAD